MYTHRQILNVLVLCSESKCSKVQSKYSPSPCPAEISSANAHTHTHTHTHTHIHTHTHTHAVISYYYVLRTHVEVQQVLLMTNRLPH